MPVYATAGTLDATGLAGHRAHALEPLQPTRIGPWAVVALPIAVRLSERATLVLDPELRVGLIDLFFGIGDGQVALRLDL